MSLPKKERNLYQDLEHLPEGVVGEILNGSLITSPRPAPRHIRSASVLGSTLFEPFDRGRGGPGGWWILTEPEIRLNGDVLVPDLAGWKRERVPVIPTDKPYFDIAPDWVCEILSNSTARVDRMIKMPIYAREKVNFIWLIDPERKTLEVYSRSESFWTQIQVFAEDMLVKAMPFQDCEIALSSLWL
jgi:Uma2 family endonuclease